MMGILKIKIRNFAMIHHNRTKSIKDHEKTVFLFDNLTL